MHQKSVLLCGRFFSLGLAPPRSVCGIRSSRERHGLSYLIDCDNLADVVEPVRLRTFNPHHRSPRGADRRRLLRLFSLWLLPLRCGRGRRSGLILRCGRGRGVVALRLSGFTRDGNGDEERQHQHTYGCTHDSSALGSHGDQHGENGSDTRRVVSRARCDKFAPAPTPSLTHLATDDAPLLASSVHCR